MPTRTRRVLQAAVLAVGVAATGAATAQAAVPAPIELPDSPIPAPSALDAELPLRLCDITEGSGVPCPAGGVDLSSPNPAGFDAVAAPARLAEPLREPGKILNGPNAQRVVLTAAEEVGNLEGYRKVRPTLAGHLDDPARDGQVLDLVAGPRHPGSGVSGADTGMDLTAVEGLRGAALPHPVHAATTVAGNVTGTDVVAGLEPVWEAFEQVGTAHQQLDAAVSDSLTGPMAGAPITGRSNPVPGFGLPGESLLGQVGVGQVLDSLNRALAFTNGNSGAFGDLSGAPAPAADGARSAPSGDSLGLLPTQAGPLAGLGLPSGLNLGPGGGPNGALADKLTGGGLTGGGLTPRSDPPTLATGVLPPVRTDGVPLDGLGGGLLSGLTGQTPAPAAKPGPAKPQAKPGGPLGPDNNVTPLNTITGLLGAAQSGGGLPGGLPGGVTGRGVTPPGAPATDLNGALPVDLAALLPPVLPTGRSVPLAPDQLIPDDGRLPAATMLGAFSWSGQLIVDGLTASVQQAADEAAAGLGTAQDVSPV